MEQPATIMLRGKQKPEDIILAPVEQPATIMLQGEQTPTKNISNRAISNNTPTELVPVTAPTTTPVTVTQNNKALADLKVNPDYSMLENTTRCEMAGGKNCNQNPFFGLDNLYEANIRRNGGRESVFDLQSRAFMDKNLGGDWRTQLGKEQQRGDLLAFANATNSPEAQNYVKELMQTNNMSLEAATAIARDKVLSGEQYYRANTLYNYPQLNKSIDGMNQQGMATSYFLDTPYSATNYNGVASSGVTSFDPKTGAMVSGGNTYNNVSQDQAGSVLGLFSAPIKNVVDKSAAHAQNVGLATIKAKAEMAKETAKAQNTYQLRRMLAQLEAEYALIAKSGGMTKEQQIDYDLKLQRLKKMIADNQDASQDETDGQSTNAELDTLLGK